MKRINKKLGQSVPEGFNGILEGDSICLDVTLRTKVKAVFLSILFYNTRIDTVSTKIIVTIGTIPLCWSGGMEVTDRFHGEVPSVISYIIDSAC